MSDPKPRKLRKLLVAMTEDDHRALLRVAGERPLGPLMVAATLVAGSLPSAVQGAATVSWRDAVARLEAHTASLRGSPLAPQAVRQLAELRRTLEAA